METNQDGTEVLETPVETEVETVETPAEPELTAEQVVELKEKAAKADELESKNKQLFERLEKQKEKTKVLSKETGDLSSKDVLFLAKADVHEEDLDTVLDWAKFKKISVSDAHKEMKSVLDVKAEERRTAAAINTKTGARGSAKVSGEELLRQAEKTGEVPDDEEGMNELFKARLARKTERFKHRR